MTDKSVLAKAQKKVKAKKGFFTHLSVYLSVGIFFLLLNVLTYDGDWWFFFPLLPWLVGLLIHYFTIFGVPGTEILTEGWEERELEKEVRAILRKEGMFSETEGELPAPPEGLELPDMEKATEKRLSDSDFV
jgi:hypothetical protein